MNPFELRVVQLFCVLAEELHFGRAASRCHMTQPSLSRAIQRLEMSLGVTLFERTSRQVGLTPSGYAFYPAAQRILEAAEAARQAARAAGAVKPILRVSSIFPPVAQFGERQLQDVLQSFAPHAELVMRQSPSILGQLHDLRMGTIDWAVTIGPLPGNTAGLTLLPLAQVRLELAIQETWQPATSEVNLAEVGLPLLLFPRHISPYHHDQLLQFLAQSGLAVQMTDASDDMEANLGAIAAGRCASLYLECLRPMHRHPGIKTWSVTMPYYFNSVILARRN